MELSEWLRRELAQKMGARAAAEGVNVSCAQSLATWANGVAATFGIVPINPAELAVLREAAGDAPPQM